MLATRSDLSLENTFHVIFHGHLIHVTGFVYYPYQITPAEKNVLKHKFFNIAVFLIFCGV